MADPNWTAQYSMAQTPEQNGFTRVLYGDPVVTLVTSGSPANRLISLNTTNGDAVFILSSVPSLNLTVGATIEVTTNCSGAGDAGFELTFSGNFFGIQIYESKITVYVNDGQEPHEFTTASNASNTIVRATVSSDKTLRVYRNGTLIDTRTMPDVTEQPLPRVLFWGEGGGTQVFKAMKYYIGGPFAP